MSWSCNKPMCKSLKKMVKISGWKSPLQSFQFKYPLFRRVLWEFAILMIISIILQYNSHSLILLDGHPSFVAFRVKIKTFNCFTVNCYFSIKCIKTRKQLWINLSLFYYLYLNSSIRDWDIQDAIHLLSIVITSSLSKLYWQSFFNTKLQRKTFLTLHTYVTEFIVNANNVLQ